MSAKDKLPVSGLRRVRRDDVKADSWVKPDGLDHCLECWKVWMGRDDTDLGMQLQKTLTGKDSRDRDDDAPGDAYAMNTKMDNEVAEATDAMIRGLKTSHQWAIKNKCSVATVWNFPQLDFVAEAQDACEQLEVKLRNNTVTKPFF